MIVLILTILIIGFTAGGIFIYSYNRKKEEQDEEADLIEQYFREGGEGFMIEEWKLRFKGRPDFTNLGEQTQKSFAKWLANREERQMPNKKEDKKDSYNGETDSKDSEAEQDFTNGEGI